MKSANAAHVRLTLPGMKYMLIAAAILVFSVGGSLTLLPLQTDRFFAWTIATPLTAAFLGAAYWAACVLELLAARERVWVYARIAVPTVLLFTILTLIVTLVHLDKFHLASPEWITRIGTYFWLFIYAVVPVVMGILWIFQLRAPGIDPPRASPPPRWLLAAMAIQAVMMLALGAALLIVPQAVAPYWPWMLTPLTGRAIGAWVFAIGVAGAQAVRENDVERVRIATISYPVMGVLELIALARFSADVNWTGVNAWLYVLFLLWLCGIGVAAWNVARRSQHDSVPVVV
jgi:hypothetical protein